jgi:hypothetical protein
MIKSFPPHPSQDGAEGCQRLDMWLIPNPRVIIPTSIHLLGMNPSEKIEKRDF